MRRMNLNLCILRMLEDTFSARPISVSLLAASWSNSFWIKWKQDTVCATYKMCRAEFNLAFGVLLSLIVCFGVIGNIISFLIWTKGRRCKKSSGGIYLRALDLSDTFVLLVCATDKATNLLSATRLSQLNTFFCKLHKTGWHFGLLVSTWIVVSFTVERTIILCRPGQSIKWTNRNRTICLIVFVYLASFLLNIPWALGNDIFVYIKNNTDSGVQNNTPDIKQFCSMSHASFIYKYNEEYHFWFIDFFLIFSLPFTTIIICNTLVLFIIIHRKKTPQFKSGPLIHGVTARAVAVSVVHCVSTGPFSVSMLVPGFYEKAYVTRTGHQYYVGVVTVVFSYLNNGVNFILYSFFGTDFRRDCVELFRRKSNVFPVDTSTVVVTHKSQPPFRLERNHQVSTASATLPFESYETDA